MKEKSVFKLTASDIKKIKKTLGDTLEAYGKGDPHVKKEGLRILNGWGRIIFIISNDGKRLGLELMERWEREKTPCEHSKGHPEGSP
ncbi:MAG: hypothetical protein HQ594_03775 [Candidatus Omnitrophica bacterium]|nr:hypothetical protein [Candidatus Omnitrophota bacterium]